MTTKTIQQAVADLEQDPEHVVTAEVNGLILEIRCTGRRTADEVFQEVGPWEGESAEELRNLLEQARAIAREEGRQYRLVLEEAMRDYVERKRGEKPRETVMAHFRSSVERNRRLGELLAK